MADIKKTEIRLPQDLYDIIYKQVYIEKRFKSLNEAYVAALENFFKKS